MSAVFEQIFEMSLMASVVIVVVVLIRLCLRKTPRKYAYALWSVAAFRLVCPVSFKAFFSLFRFVRTVEGIQTVQTVTNPVPTVSPGYFDSVSPEHFNSVPPVEFDPDYMVTYPLATPPAAEIPWYATVDWVRVAAIVWLVGLAALLIYGIVSYVRLRRRMDTAVRSGEDVWYSDRVQSPFILGFARPNIYMPFGLTEDQQRYVLAHERYHLKRFDHIVRPLSFLILAVHWFNPFVWLAYYLMGRDMEMSCDEKVLSTENSIRKAYSTTLLSFAANRRFPAPSPLAFSESGVKGRIKNVLNWKKPRTWVTVIAIIVCIVVIVVCAANPAAHPYDWTKNLTVEDVEWAELMVNGEEETERRLSETEREELVALINGLSKDELEQPPKQSVWAFPTERMLTICCGGVEYVLNLGPDPMTLSSKDGSVDWGSGDPWFIGNDELKEFVRQMPALIEPTPENPPVPPVDDPSNPVEDPNESVEPLKVRHFADLTHDGVDETITLTYQEEMGLYTLMVANAEGEMLWQGNAGLSHVDWNGFYLYEKDGQQYLMSWLPYGNTGLCSYIYEIFSLSETGEQILLTSGSFLYGTNTVEELLSIDIEGLKAFEAEVNALLEDAIVLITTDEGTPYYSTRDVSLCKLWSAPLIAVQEWKQSVVGRLPIVMAYMELGPALLAAVEEQVAIHMGDYDLAYVEQVKNTGGSTYRVTFRPGDYDGVSRVKWETSRYFDFAMDENGSSASKEALRVQEYAVCKVSGAETDYSVIARSLAEQYVKCILNRPDWADGQVLDVQVASTEVFDAYYGTDNPNFCFSKLLYVKVTEEQRNYWETGSGLGDMITEGPYAGYYVHGMEVTVRKLADGNWHMTGMGTGGAMVSLPVKLDNATTQQLMELYFLTAGDTHDWRILYYLGETPVEEVRTGLNALDAQKRQELTDALLEYVTANPDYAVWTAEDL